MRLLDGREVFEPERSEESCLDSAFSRSQVVWQKGSYSGAPDHIYMFLHACLHNHLLIIRLTRRQSFYCISRTGINKRHSIKFQWWAQKATESFCWKGCIYLLWMIKGKITTLGTLKAGNILLHWINNNFFGLLDDTNEVDRLSTVWFWSTFVQRQF
jgi:hypothetical protein